MERGSKETSIIIGSALFSQEYVEYIVFFLLDHEHPKAKHKWSWLTPTINPSAPPPAAHGGKCECSVFIGQ